MIFVLGLIWIIDQGRKEIIKARQDKELKEQFEKWVRRTEDILYSYFRELHFAISKEKSFKNLNY